MGVFRDEIAPRTSLVKRISIAGLIPRAPVGGPAFED